MNYSHYVACAMRFYIKNTDNMQNCKTRAHILNYETCTKTLGEFSSADRIKIVSFYKDGKTDKTDFKLIRRFERLWAEMRGI